MSEPVEQPVRAHQSYRHEAFLYRGDADFLRGILPFVRDGVELGQPVMVVVSAPRLDLLRDAVGSTAEGVVWLDMAEHGRNPARIIPAWLDLVEEHPGQPVRGIGEPVWAARRSAELVECQLHEALLNLAIEPDTPLWLRCPYDLDTLAPEVVDAAFHSHPAIVEADDYRGSTVYGGSHHAAALFAAQLPEPDRCVTDMPFDRDSLSPIRHVVVRRALAAGLDQDRAMDVALAVTELATNSVLHAGGRGSLRVWQDDEVFACEVSDAGHVDDPLVGRRRPPTDGQGGRGVWLAHQLMDLVQIRSASTGTAVRVLSWR
jgi:anti-sigma regulatory factor (Ser/Thr protein kinase)